MRGLLLSCELLMILPIVTVRPFIGVILWSWISFMSPHRLVWGFATDLPWALITFLFIPIGCFIAREPRRVPQNPVFKLIFVFLLCISLTSLAALAPPDAVYEKWLITAKMLIGVIFTGLLLTERRRIHALIWIMCIALGFYGVKGGAFTLMHGGHYTVWGPPDTMIFDNNQLATALLVVLPLMNYLRLQSKYRAIRIGLGLAMGLTLSASVGSYSRGALLGMVAVVAFLWLRSPRKLLSGMVLVVALAGMIAFMPGQWAERMDTIKTYQQDESATDRLAIWGAAWRLAEAHPLTGAGFMGTYYYSVLQTVDPGVRPLAAHSIWFEVLGEHGFPTFFVWLAISLSGLLMTRRTIVLARDRPELKWASDLARMTQVSMIGYMVAGSFLSLSYWDFYFTLMVTAGATRDVALATVQQREGTGGRLPAMGRRRALALARAGGLGWKEESRTA